MAKTPVRECAFYRIYYYMWENILLLPLYFVLLLSVFKYTAFAINR